MNVDQAKREAQKIIGPEVVLEKRNGICCVLRPATEQEKTIGHSHLVKESGNVVIGSGPSWLAALRYAVRPILARAKVQEDEDRKDIRREAEQFALFLREKHDEEFKAWVKQHFPEPAPEAAPAPAAPAP